MLSTSNIQQVAKHSMAYGYMISQPFAFYVDAYPMIQNEIFQNEDVAVEFGEHNQAVRVLQKKLNYLSYYNKEIDGEFGIFTEYALKKLQIEHDLSITGKTDQQTINIILSREREKYLAPLKDIDQTYYLGETGEAIKSIQQALYYFGYYKDSLDGIFGPKTNQALMYFQEDNGLEVRQEINQETIQTLQQKETEAKTAAIEVAVEVKTNQEKSVKEDNATPKESVVVPKKETNQSVDINQLITTAKQYRGTTYLWGGTSPSGFDCSGYIQYVFQQIGISIPRTVSEIWNMSVPVEQRSIGDLVFFETYKSGPSHMGIYLGNNQFIHAGESNGVEISDLGISYWQERYIGTKRMAVEK
ncbi:NlpC/P60 family protein [Paraliobacillus zengyii]|uniref:C40 family peptidase n=1 Tax=Paraliobacillus zengyii TaxID=2213194 RepID=UPI000DD2DDDF|nr:NlpC/P60 family protein [Paraliobacillus zengyii]